MKQKEIPQTKTEWLKLYLASMEYYQCQLLDILRQTQFDIKSMFESWEINHDEYHKLYNLRQQEYDKEIKESQEAYYKFIANLTEIPFNQ